MSTVPHPYAHAVVAGGVCRYEHLFLPQVHKLEELKLTKGKYSAAVLKQFITTNNGHCSAEEVCWRVDHCTPVWLSVEGHGSQ